MEPQAVLYSYGNETRCVCAYDANFLAVLRGSGIALWKPLSKCFVVYDVRRWCELAAPFYEIVDTITRKDIGTGRATGTGMPSEDWATLGCAPKAPMEIVDAAYKILAKRYHPDTGGSHERMVKLNAAYERIKALSGTMAGR